MHIETDKSYVILKSGKSEAIKRFHPWVFSGAIKKFYGTFANGDLVEVYSNQYELLGTGHYQKGSIAIRVIAFGNEQINDVYWKNRLQSAYDLRKTIGLTNNDNTNIYRLVFAEADRLPGLIIDIYSDTAVIQAHSAGMHLNRQLIADHLIEIYGDRLNTIYYKSKDTISFLEDIDAEDEFLLGDKTKSMAIENGLKFNVDWEEGQKTGFFIDQRENRKLLAKYSKDRTVLNTFCYTGGFSVFALDAGAKMVHSVDSSAKAIELTDENVELNGLGDRHASFVADTLKYMQDLEESYDLIVLDPPAYAKSRKVLHNAIQGYKRLNAKALEKINKGGILFTFSCSQVISNQAFESTVIAAAIQSKRNIRIIHRLFQPSDHPISAFHPEGSYLKGLVLYVE